MLAFASLVAGMQEGDNDSDDKYLRVYIMPAIRASTKRKHGGSEPEKRAAQERKRAVWGE
ncbi:Transposon protein [Phytophthora palmivora]|uniref:Transposon protein n=1 Tax=Phytophthora palmivora TaxID=4796 RepID=A0A2P4YLI0_9STRA|nr:Transposon protein [Phytophthora palmivora]